VELDVTDGVILSTVDVDEVEETIMLNLLLYSAVETT